VASLLGGKILSRSDPSFYVENAISKKSKKRQSAATVAKFALFNLSGPVPFRALGSAA